MADDELPADSRRREPVVQWEVFAVLRCDVRRAEGGVAGGPAGSTSSPFRLSATGAFAPYREIGQQANATPRTLPFPRVVRVLGKTRCRFVVGEQRRWGPSVSAVPLRGCRDGWAPPRRSAKVMRYEGRAGRLGALSATKFRREGSAPPSASPKAQLLGSLGRRAAVGRLPGEPRHDCFGLAMPSAPVSRCQGLSTTARRSLRATTLGHHRRPSVSTG